MGGILKTMTTFSVPASAITLAEGNVVSEKVQLFRTGTFYHSEYGKFDITADMLKQMSENFTKNVRGVDIAIDYKHDSEDVAAGWIRSVQLASDGTELWAEVDWTPKGNKVLSDKEFRYLSPEFMFDYQDNESLQKFGPTLLGAGLTNRPTIKKMDPVVQLSEFKVGAQSAEPTELEKKKLAEQGRQNRPKGVKSMDYKKMDLAAVETLSPEQAKEAVKELLGAAKELETAQTKLAEFETATKLSEKKGAFAKLLSEGKACKAQEEAFLSGDMAKFAELSSGVKLNDGKGGSGEPTEVKVPATVEEAQDEVLKLAEAKVSGKTEKNMASAISAVLKERNDLKVKIYG
jgi:phage I-like protein